MHNRFKIAVLASLICISSSVFAVVEDYIGISYKNRSMHGHNTSTYDTRTILPNDYRGGEVYYMHRFADDVGVYVGYEQSQKEYKSYVFSVGQLFLGSPQQAGDTSVTRTSIKALQFDMVGFIDVLRCFEAIGQFGFSIMHADMSGTITSNGVTTNLAPGDCYKFIPRLSLGLQYFLYKRKFGIRLMGDWEGTNLYRMNMTDDDGVRYSIRPFKQSWCFMLGVFACVN